MHKKINVGNIKCHKCRHIVLADINTTYKGIPCTQRCGSYNSKSVIYLVEDQLPEWIKVKVEEEQWTKGKLHCEHCGCKVGTFDFVSGRKCECGETVLPPVNFALSQIDVPILLPNFNK